jgi:hypothetical protein
MGCAPLDGMKRGWLSVVGGLSLQEMHPPLGPFRCPSSDEFSSTSALLPDLF